MDGWILAFVPISINEAFALQVVQPMTFSSRWLLAFRVGGATVALLTHCPLCHVVFNHSSWLVRTPPARHCQVLQQKGENYILVSASCSPLLDRNTSEGGNPFSFPGVKLDPSSVKRLRVWPSPGVACHIQLWATNRNTHLFLFSCSEKKETSWLLLVFLSSFFFWGKCCVKPWLHLVCLRGLRMLRYFSHALGSVFFLFFFVILPSPHDMFSVGTYPRKYADYIIWGSSKKRRSRKASLRLYGCWSLIQSSECGY